jgi:hypothetical protein
MVQYGSYDGNIWLSFFNVDTAAGAAVTRPSDIALEAAAGDMTGMTWTINFPARVIEFGYHVTVAFDYDTLVTTGVIALDKRVLSESDTGRVEVVRLNLVDGLAQYASCRAPRALVGSTAGNLEPGDQLVCEIVTQAVGGTEVGDYYPYVVIAPRAETPRNITDYTESSIAQVST